MDSENTLDISWGTIFKLGIFFIAFYILYQVKDIFVWIIFALIISILFDPTINFLQRKRIPRVLAAIFVYVGFFGLISYLIYLTIPVFFQEIQQFLQIFPQYFEKISPPLRGLGLQAFESMETLINAFGKTLEKMATNIFTALFAIFGGIFSTLSVITIAFFLSLEENEIERSLAIIFPKKYEDYVLDLWNRCQVKVSGWFWTRIVASLFVGLLSYFVFFLFNVKYIFALSSLAGILNFIPVVGPVATGILIFTIISLESTSRAFLALIAFTLIQQIENNILSPILTKRFIGLPPVLVLISLAIGGKLWGLLGAILVIPLVGIIYEFLKDFLQKKREEEPPVS